MMYSFNPIDGQHKMSISRTFSLRRKSEAKDRHKETLTKSKRFEDMGE